MIYRFFKKLCVALFMACLIFEITPATTEAADVQTVIYNEVLSCTGNIEHSQWLTQAILYASGLYGVDPLLVTAVMENESGCNIYVSPSRAGAIGLMQLMPETAISIGVDPYDPLGNIIGGASYLRTMLDRFSAWGQYAVAYAIAAYNAGPNAVSNYGGLPPYAETYYYVQNVASSYNYMLSIVG